MMVEPLGDGGIAHYTYNLINALIRNNIECQLYTTFNYEFNNERLTFKLYNRMFCLANIILRWFPILSKEYPLPSLFRRIIKSLEYPFNTIEAVGICKRERINCVHIQSVNLIELFFIFFLKLFNIKVVYTIHNVLPRHKRLKRYHKILYFLMYYLCDEVIIHTEKGKEEIINYYNVSRYKINIIPHGDYKFFLPEKKYSKEKAKSILDLSVECKTILFFGAIRENKGLEQILFALPYILNNIPNLKLMIVGEPWGSFDKYEKIAKKNNVAENIFKKLEYVSNKALPIYFFAADLVVLPYHEVTGSGVLQIAYAFSKPVVASDIDGFREVIANGKNGYIVPLCQHRMLGRRIVEILSDDNKIDQMGRYSRYLSDNKFSWDNIAKQTIEVYNKILK